MASSDDTNIKVHPWISGFCFPLLDVPPSAFQECWCVREFLLFGLHNVITSVCTAVPLRTAVLVDTDGDGGVKSYRVLCSHVHMPRVTLTGKPPFV